MKRKAWKLVLGLLGSMVLVVGGIVWDAHRRATALLDRERATVEAGMSAWLSRDHTRPSALADPIEGNAWDYYGPAAAQLAAMPKELNELFPSQVDPSEENTPDDHAIQNLILECRPELERLRKGARCRIVHLRAQTLHAQDPLPLTDVLHACKILADIVAHEHRMGRDEEALATAATGLTLAQDYGRSGTLMSALVQFTGEGYVLAALKEAFEETPLDPAPLEEFVAVLDRLDASRPAFMDCWKGEELYMKRVVIDSDWDGLFPYFTSLGSKPPKVWPSWRALYSKRITRAQALPRYSEIYRSLDRLQVLPAWERVAEAKELDQENDPNGPRGDRDNVILDAIRPAFGRPFEQDAVIQMQRLLLRLSVAIARLEAAEGRFPDRLDALIPRYLPQVPVCPLTGLPLLYRDGKVWSVGKNRVDDGGTPGRDNEATDDDGDVVWVVQRRK